MQSGQQKNLKGMFLTTCEIHAMKKWISTESKMGKMARVYIAVYSLGSSGDLSENMRQKNLGGIFLFSLVIVLFQS